jgi:hypothetical protein
MSDWATRQGRAWHTLTPPSSHFLSPTRLHGGKCCWVLLRFLFTTSRAADEEYLEVRTLGLTNLGTVV